MKRILYTITALAAALLALVGLSGTAGAADRGGTHGAFSAQAASLGLTPAEADHLQARVDREIQRSGGTQTALNEIRHDGVTTVLTAPGQRQARPLTTGGANSNPPTAHRCPYYYFCWYDSYEYTGDMHYTKTCNVYYTVTFEFIGSYYNNQTPGTQARFYDWNKKYFMSSRPAPASEPYPWPRSDEIVSILACHTP